MHLVIDSKIPFIRGYAEQLGTCTYLPGAEITASDVREADALRVYNLLPRPRLVTTISTPTI